MPGRLRARLALWTAIILVAFIVIYVTDKPWFLHTGAPWIVTKVTQFSAMVALWPIATVLLPVTTLIMCFIRVVGTLATRDVEIGRIRIGPFFSLAFFAYWVVCLPVALVVFALTEQTTIGAVLSAVAGVFGTVDVAGTKVSGLGTFIDKLNNAIAARMGRDITEQAAAEAAAVAAKLARSEAVELRAQLAVLGMTDAEMDDVAKRGGFDDSIERARLASAIVKKNLDHARQLADGRIHRITSGPAHHRR